MGINLNEAIIVFDEAHNLEDVAEDSCSFELSFDDLLFTKNIESQNKMIQNFL